MNLVWAIMVAAIVAPAHAQKAKPKDPEAELKPRAERSIAAIANATLTFAMDFADRLPRATTQEEFEHIVAIYVSHSREPLAFRDPNPARAHFMLNLTYSGRSANSFVKPKEEILVYETKPWKDGRRLVAYADGHAAWIDAKAWKKIEPTLNKKAPRGERRGRKG